MTKSAITPYPLRLDPELRKRLEYVAKQSGRSLQSEIAARLEQSLEDEIQKIITAGDAPAPRKLQIDNLAEIIAIRIEERMHARNAAAHGLPSTKANRTLDNAPTIDDIPTLADAPTLADVPTLDDLPSLSDDTKPRRIRRTPPKASK